MNAGCKVGIVEAAAADERFPAVPLPYSELLRVHSAAGAAFGFTPTVVLCAAPNPVGFGAAAGGASTSRAPTVVLYVVL